MKEKDTKDNQESVLGGAAGGEDDGLDDYQRFKMKMKESQVKKDDLAVDPTMNGAPPGLSVKAVSADAGEFPPFSLPSLSLIT